MKKLFTLLTLLLTLGGANSAWADPTWTVDYSSKAKNWTVTDNQETLVVSDYGTVTLDYNLGGKTDVYGNQSYLKFSGNSVSLTITLPTGKKFKAGEKIKVTGKGGKSTAAGCVYVVIGENIIKAVDIAASSQATFDSGELEIPEGFAESSTLVIRRASSSEKQTDGSTSCGGTFYIQKIIYTEQAKTITSQTFAGVKVGSTALTADAATNGYSVATNTITLSDDIETISAPTNIKLINHIVYSDASEKDNEVAVTFDGTVTAGYFIGSATIDETEYTVKVKKVTSPTAELSAANGSIALTESWKTGSVTVTLTGANLTDGEYNVTADVAGVTISPATFTVASGAVNQEFTLTSTATTAASTVITFGTAAIGTAAPTYTLTYSQSAAKRDVPQTDVVEATTWDWTKAGDASIELTATTIPANGSEFILAELPEITNDATFNSQALKVACQWPNRGTNYYLQGNTIKFNVLYPGTVEVWFSNTSNRTDTEANRRYLYVNGTNSGVYTLTQTFEDSGAMPVNAGEVVINAYTGEATPAATMVRINKIVYTPTAEVVSTLSGRSYGSFVTSQMLDFASAEGITAYIATGLNGAKDAVVLQSVDVVPAGTAIIVKTETQGATVNVPVTTAEASDVTANLLVAGDGTTVANSDYYYLASDQFHLATSGTLQSGKAYLQIPATARNLSIIIGGDATGISAIAKSQEPNANGYYNLAGQRVAQPQKGLYIQNGKKVIIK